MSEAIFYKMSSDRKKINKTLGNVIADINTIKIKTPCSVMNPSIQVSASAIGTEWVSINYVKIPEYGRYYFVENITSENYDILTIELKCDVLMSYRDQIMQSQFQILRAQHNYDKYFIDTQIPLKASRKLDYDSNDPSKYQLGSIPQSTGSGAYNYVMTVAGG